jgi:myo-inositol-1(or 4)-monophosphatase
MDFLSVAIAAARKAGAVHKKYYGKKTAKVRQKKVSFDLITAADTEAEAAAVSLIRRSFPDHNFLGEESKYRKTASEYTWIIDPLDGTNNFACGIPIFCASVGLKYKDAIVAGAVFDVIKRELFYAAKGKGAFLNGKRMSVNSAGTLKESMLITGFYYDRGKDMIETLEAIKLFNLKHILGIRRLGAAALDLCYVACGRAAGFWEHKLSPWDFAAGKLLIEEAGGQVTGRKGEPVPLDEPSFIVSSNGLIHRQMLSVISSARE